MNFAPVQTRRLGRIRLLAVFGVLVLAAAGCGSDADSDALAPDAFDGLSIVVGSKNFTEQYLLSEILIQALVARGADVTDATDTGDTATTRQALLNGDIDAYWEYNSTGWVQHLGRSDPDDNGEELTEQVRDLDATENNISWVGRSSFNDTYGFAIGPVIAEEVQATRYSVEAFNLDAMAEYLSENDEAVVCVEPEFAERADGLVLFTSETEFTIPDDQLRIIEDEGDIYPLTASGVCDFGEVFTTDGRIDALDLVLVVDPGVFYVYNVSLNIPDDVYGQASESFDALVDRILRPLSQSRITALNRQVNEGTPVSRVAADYLQLFEINR
ncbi:MAG: glycine betaine ABC transporter substrate-binding protein [Acidimicrobiia bacterium]